MDTSVSSKIKELDNIVTFWCDVKNIIPNDNEEQQIEQWRKEAEVQYNKLITEKWSEILRTWTDKQFSNSEVERIVAFFKNHKREVIEQICEL